MTIIYQSSSDPGKVDFVDLDDEDIAVVYCQITPHHDEYSGAKTPQICIFGNEKQYFLHVHYSSFDILKAFSFFLRREMTCFVVVWTTRAYDDKCSILSSYVLSAGSNLIPGPSCSKPD